MMKKLQVCILTSLIGMGWIYSESLAQTGLFDKSVDWPLIGNLHAEGEAIVEGTGVDAIYKVLGNGIFGDRVEPFYNFYGDEGFYLYTLRSGSWSLQAKMSAIWGPSALMIREVAADPTANFYSVQFGGIVGEAVNALFRTRTGAGGNVSFQLYGPDGEPIADTGQGMWFRVTRVEPVDVFFGEYSPDGVNWHIADSRVIDWPSAEAAFGIASGSGGDDEELGEVHATQVSFVSPPPVAKRIISQQFYKSGDVLTVQLTVYVSGSDRSSATIEEVPPADWTISEIGQAGTSSGGIIRWNLNNLPVGETVLSYKVTVPSAPEELANWTGKLKESVNILGSTTLPLLNITGGERVEDGIVVLYTFEEGDGSMVHDVSNVGEPMNLLIEDTKRVLWGDGYLETTGVNHIETQGPATKIIQACKLTNELTVEGWIKTSDISQNGPARIITCSLDTTSRNFTLGQGRYNAGSNRMEMRYRTTENSEFQADSPIGSLTEALTHVVWTRAASGSVAVYINNGSLPVFQNGNIPIDNVPGEFSNWDDTYKFGLGNEVSAARAWLGQFHLVAIYNRYLSADEVARNYNAGPFIQTDTSVIDWPVFR